MEGKPPLLSDFPYLDYSMVPVIRQPASFPLSVAAASMPGATRHVPGLCVVRGARGAVTVIPVTAQHLIFRFRGGYSGCRSVRDVGGYAFISSFLHLVWSSLSLIVYVYPVSRGVTGSPGPLFQPYPLNLPGITFGCEFNDRNKCLLIISQR